jgi:MFS family permease
MSDSRRSAVRFIVALGTISLLADVTYEGARSINGPFLGMLGAGAAAVGIISGAGELAGYMLRLAGGVTADRTHRYWTLMIAGYAINLFSVPLLAFAGSWGTAAVLMVAERAGKGIRTPARAVMLSQAAHQVGRGWGFGLHEFMDQTGAFLGPLLIAFIVSQSAQYSRAYALLAIPALLAIATLFAAVRFYPDPSRFESRESRPGGAAERLPLAFWIYVAAAGLLGAGFVDFPLIAFHFQKTALTSLPTISVFYAIAMGVEAFAALIFGRLFDRIGMPAVIFGVLLSAASSPLVFFGSFDAALAGMALWGAGMGALQTPLNATIANLVPTSRRGTAYGIFHSVFGGLWFVGSATIGILYAKSLTAAVAFAMIAQLAAIPLFLIVRRRPA